MNQCKQTFSEQELFQLMETHFKTDNHFEIDTDFAKNVGRMAIRSEKILPHILFGHFHSFFQQATELRMEKEADTGFNKVIFSYMLNGHFCSKMDSSAEYESHKSNSFSIKYAPGISGTWEFLSKNPSDSVVVQVDIEHFLQLIESDSRDGVKNLFSDLFSPFNGVPLLLRARTDAYMTKLLQKLSANPSHNTLSGNKRQAMVLKLIQYSLDKVVDHHCREDGRLNLNLVDTTKLEHAKTILQESLDNPPTIQGLSREIGLNDFKLKKGFKQLNQTTVHEYVSNLRMQKAAKLLLHSNLSIINIAHRVGYANHGHFSVAFRKHYGRSPSQYRR